MHESTLQESTTPRPTCDVVVIGGGIGGLTAGAILAKSGLDVQILESNSKPGGYLTTFGRDGFLFDAAVHWLNLCGPGQVIRNILEYAAGEAPIFPEPRCIRRYKSREFDYTLTSTPDQLRQELKADFPRDIRGIDAFFDAAHRVGRAFSAFSRKIRTPSTMNILEKLRSGVCLGMDSFPLWRYSGVPSAKGLAQYFSNPLLKDMFASEELLIACLMPIGWAYTHNYQLLPMGGSSALTQWVSRAAISMGAEIHCNTRVNRILTDSGRVSKVAYESNSNGMEPKMVNCKYVVAASDAISVLTELLDADAVPQNYIKKQLEADLYSSAVTVSLGLDVPSESLGFDESLMSLTNNRQPRAEHNGGNPSKAAMSILARTVTDKSMAPPGKGTLTLFAQAEMNYRDRWRTGPKFSRNQSYRELKERYAEVLIERTADAMCGRLRDHIELIDVATPVTYWRYTGNHRGSMMGQRPTKRNIYNRVAGYITPIEGLYRAGHWSEYGGGIPAAVRAAANSTLHILQREKSDTFRVLADVLDSNQP